MFFSLLLPLDSLFLEIDRVGPEKAQLITSQLQIFENCQGHYTQNVCTLVSGILEYDIEIRGNVVSISNFGSYDTSEMANNTFLNVSASGEQPLTYENLLNELDTLVFSNVSLEDHPNGTLSGATAGQVNAFAYKYSNWTTGRCEIG